MELAGVPMTSQKASEVEIAKPTPTSNGFVPDVIAMSSTTGPITATVAPALMRLVRLAPIATTRRIRAVPELIPRGSKVLIMLSASHPAAPDVRKTVPRLIAPA